jgi:phosphoglycolate phosphatase
MPRRLILWDIDGTLLTTGSAGRLALEHGTMAATGLHRVLHIEMSGKTDPQIVREMLVLEGLSSAEIDRAIPVALKEAEHALQAESERMLLEGRVHPGVRALLDALSETTGVRQSLLTGNVAMNAVVKVRTFGLESYFDFEIGAYGTDSADRAELVPFALRRARELRGEAYEPEEVWIIGDTQNDLRCATAAGAHCLLVGTGKEGITAVASLPADAVLEDLSDTDRVLGILLASD